MASENNNRPFLDFYQERLIGMKTGIVKSIHGDLLSPRSIGSYETIYNHAVRFIGDKVVYPDEMDETWYEGFRDYLIFLDLRKNTISSTLGKLKTFQRKHCKAERIFFPADDFKLSNELTTKVFVGPEEIHKLLQSRYNWGRTRIRDAFVLQCHCGLRFSDMRRLLKEPRLYVIQVQDRLFFRITTQKTDQDVVIPISKIMLEILERRNWDFGGMMSIQLYNRFIKEICKQAGLTTEVVERYTKGGKKHAVVRPKYELVSSHTARRSFATNAFLAGVPSMKIRKITGHTTEQSFQTYIRADSLESALSLVDHPFFQ
ncbi:phage integrase SAM-like domain-containing protein [Rhabdobacter roseus]|uniref:Integrase n=1 Tax=Rhabdobacter roseus TaxID=1655419 RepID=A0A840TWU1_9BACT|nr:tyrosine-type recombinase/integrase [Rhabdobacter roseus]MBB5284410.1 integrase [Rhabdobacter roseus]